MKVLFVGASGAIGSKVLEQCLAHPGITTVVAFVRRELPTSISNHNKLECVIKKDFARWEDDELQGHADAVAMVWTMGTNAGDAAVDLEYPSAFQARFLQIIRENSERPRFRFILLSGKFVVRDQEKGLCFLEKARKLKGQLETRTMALAEEHPSKWQVYIVRPGGVMSQGMFGEGITGAMLSGIGTMLGKHWSINVRELGAFMAEAAANGGGKDGIIENVELVERGRGLLGRRAQLGSGDLYSGAGML